MSGETRAAFREVLALIDALAAAVEHPEDRARPGKVRAVRTDLSTLRRALSYAGRDQA